MLLVCRFTVTDSEAFVARAERALELLVAQPGCRRTLLGRATDADASWLVTVEFDSITAYRRALGPIAVRELVIPFLAEADHAAGPASYELVLRSGPAGSDTAVDQGSPALCRIPSVLAADADDVGPGNAAGPAIPR